MPDVTTATHLDVDRTITVSEPLPDRRSVEACWERLGSPSPDTTTAEDEGLHVLWGATLPATSGR